MEQELTRNWQAFLLQRAGMVDPWRKQASRQFSPPKELAKQS